MSQMPNQPVSTLTGRRVVRRQPVQTNANNPYRTADDIPRWQPVQGMNRQFNPRGSIVFRGRAYTPEQFQREFPRQFADLQGTSAQGGAPAGGFPAVVAPNTTDYYLRQAEQQAAEARAANERRYSQNLETSRRQEETIRGAFDSVLERLSADEQQSRGAIDAFVRTTRDNAAAVDAGFASAEGLVSQVGQRAVADARRSGRENEAFTTGEATARGLGTTTVLDSLRTRDREATGRTVAGVEESIASMLGGLRERRTAATGNANAAVAGAMLTQAGVDQENRLRQTQTELQAAEALYGVFQNRIGIRERRTDLGPDAGQLAAAAAAQAQAEATARAARRSSNPFSQILSSIAGGVTGGIGTGIGNWFGNLFG